MDILQLPTLALDARIDQELDANPALEIVADEPAPAAAPEPAGDDRPEGEVQAVIVAGDAHDFERLDRLVREYDWFEDEPEYRGTRSRARAAEEGDFKLDAMANTAARPVGLHEHLHAQWRMAELDPRVRQIGARIIDQIEASGRLATPLEQIASEVTPPATPEEVSGALAAVQRLEPAGIGARDVRECLLLQLEALPGDNELEKRIVREHLADVQKNRLPAIAHALGIELDEVQAALEVLATLALQPGHEERAMPRIVPDVVVEYDERTDRYEVRLTRGNTRELRIAPEFRELLEQARDDKTTRDFVKQKIEAASAIIDAVRYRRERLLDVARAVVEAQREFLERGEQHLRVLRMSDLAARFNCDPSTISRTVDEKYMQTPRGIYPLRMFFTGGAETDDGEALGWASIKAKVQEIIAAEDRHRPFSDDEIVTRLRTEGIDIKRRTVAKYRGQLGIPAGRQRRAF
jgi:RNA polymerase sigma-54 factor